MITDTFLLGFQRFIGRRGLPHTIYTDNEQTFHTGNGELAELCGTLSAAKTHRPMAQYGVIWKFIAPRAAWWGWWEGWSEPQKMPMESIGAVTSHGRRVGHHCRQHRSRPEFDTHNSGHRGRIDTITFPSWRKTDSVTLWNRATNGEKSHEGTPQDTNLARRLLETLRKEIPHRLKKLP